MDKLPQLKAKKNYLKKEKAYINCRDVTEADMIQHITYGI